MAKYKAAKKKTDAPTQPQMRPGVPCLIILIAGMILTILVMILAVRNAA